MSNNSHIQKVSVGRRNVLKTITAGSTGFALGSFNITGCSKAESNESLKAGFARVKITSPIGTAMTGFGARDYDPCGCKDVHDDIFARALYLSKGNREALIMGFDLLFFSRDETDRFKGAVGRKIDLLPSQILLNTSHTHTGPKVGTWFYTPSDRYYLQFLENAIVQAAISAKNSARDVTIRKGVTRTKLPMSRRKRLPNGLVDFAPNPNGAVCDTLPITLLKDKQDKPVCLMFAVSCHPSTVKGVDRSYCISADYPGTAMAALDDYLGTHVSLFLQGAGGDSKASVIGKGEEQWRAGTWDDVDRAGAMVAEEIIPVLESGLAEVKPELVTTSIEMEWPLVKPFSRAEYEDIVKNPNAHSESMPEVMRTWAKEQIHLLDRGYNLPTKVPIAAHGIYLGEGLRMVGIEGELVGELGNLIEQFYGGGVTYAMGYTDGTQMYLPTSNMLDEGGYEVESYWEYRQPAPLAKGHEKILTATLEHLRQHGIV